jgi:ubiquinol-cytochrome c reductase cytochrome b/c1 subunit
MRIQRKLLAQGLLAALVAGAAAAATNPAVAQDAEAATPPKLNWSFAGPFGTYDQGQLQRGLKIYHDVCSNCHGLSLVAFRNLADPGGPGYSPAQAAAYAAQYKLTAADHFPSPNEAVTSAFPAKPPDMSVLAKARGYRRGFPGFVFDFFTQYQEQGPDYIAALLKGYENPPAGVTVPPGTFYNKYFPSHNLGMPQPLFAGQITYEDGSPATLEQYSQDIAAFLMWAAEPKLVQRKRIGFQVIIYLIVLGGLLYLTKKKVWRGVEQHA